MICRNCGKEIPDDVKYCGYCGALQIDENNEQTVDTENKAEEEIPAAVSEEENKDMPSSNESTVTDETESLKQPEQKQESEPDAAEKEDQTAEPEEKEEVTEAETVEKKNSDSSEQSEKKAAKKQTKEKLKNAGAKIADSAEPIIENSRKAVHKADWSAFGVYKDILKSPFEKHDVDALPLWTGIVIMILGSWFTFGSFGNGLFVLVFTFAGLMIAEYIAGKGNEEYHLNKSFEHAFSYAAVPFIAALAAGIIFHSAGGDASVLIRRLGLVIALLVFAASVYGKAVSQCAGQSNKWLTVIILTAVYSSVLYYLLMQHISAITAIISML